MTERIVDDEQNMHVVPPALRSVGVLVEPLTIAEKALIQVWDVQERLPWTAAGRSGDGHGQRAVVLGAGPVGLLGLMALLRRGFETWVYSREPAGSRKSRWVESIGGHYASSSMTTLTALADEVAHVDLVYEATGAAALSFEALAILGVNGVFVFTGVPGRKGQVEIEGGVLMRNMVLKNQLLFGTVNAGPDAFEAAVSDLAAFQAQWPEQLGGLITSRVEPEGAPDLLTGEPSGIKAVVSFGSAR
jgi:threonine dehydrogenase-like Zn-dependent dehydrogenase